MEPKSTKGVGESLPPSVIQVTNPAAFSVPEVQDLIIKGLKSLYDTGMKPELLWNELLKWVTGQEGVVPAVFIGFENNKFLSFLLLDRPRTIFDPYPNIVYFQNLGSNSLRRLMISRLIDHVRWTGYKVLSFTNGTTAPDSVYVRSLCRTGKTQLTGRRILWEFDDEGTVRG